MKNKLEDLNDHLFAQLERLSDESLKGDALAAEIERSAAVQGIAREVISNARLVLDAHKAVTEGIVAKKLPKLLEPGE